MSNKRLVLAFYGLSTSPEGVANFYGLTNKWFNSLGCTPDRASVWGPGFTGKVGSFIRADARLGKGGFGNVKAFSVHSSLPGAIVPAMEYYASAAFSRRKYGGYAVLAVPALGSAPKDWLQVAKEIAGVLDPDYGIGYLRELDRGPVFYAIGIVQGESESSNEGYEEKLRIGRWGDIGMSREVYRSGLLRDVYKWNFLTRSQLSRKVIDMTLEKWITGFQGHGTLSPFLNEMSLWEVSEPELEEARRALQDAGCIFNWSKYV